MEEPRPLELPFAVDHHFVATGFMGDGVDGRTLQHDDLSCLWPRPPGAQGMCHRFRYFPASSLVAEWAGVYWQNEPDNWGQSPGVALGGEPREIVFSAASDPPGLEVTFLAGGIDTPGRQHRDAFTASQSFVLSSTYQELRLELPAASYEEVLGGFGVVITRGAAMAVLGDGTESVLLFVDDITWR